MPAIWTYLMGSRTLNHGVCSVSIKRNLRVAIQGRPSRGVGMEEIMFESLDQTESP
ncbi:hypothetical protein PO124_15615 [Bacillus licheniformis]|nr:hypothetical protein [Bacillus licheniformis]